MIAALLLAVGIAAARQPGPVTRILVVYSHTPDAPGMSSFAQQFRYTVNVQSNEPVEYYHEFLDPDRLPVRHRWQHLAEYFAYKYQDLKLNVIVAEGSPALEFVMSQLRPLFGDVPVVFTLAIEPPPDIATLPPYVTGRLTKLAFGGTFELARRLQPDAKRVVIVSGAAHTDSIIREQAISEIAPRRGSLDVQLAPDLPYEGLVEYLHRLPPQTIVLLTFYRRDIRGRYIVPGEVIARMSAESAAPVYGTIGSWFGQGIVGGALLQFSEEGARTATLVMRTIHRAPGEPLPRPEIGRGILAVDQRQLTRWRLSQARVPSGVEILFRDASAWERHRNPILVALGIILAQTMLISLLLVERNRRIRAQSAVQEQLAYEEAVGGLAAGVLHHAPEEVSGALEEALGRVGRYAGASRVVLVQYADASGHPTTRIVWSARPPGGPPSVTDGWSSPLASDTKLEIPLFADEAPLGRLELYHDVVRQPWSERLLVRVEACAELLANSLARARAARSIRQGEELNRAVLASISAQIAILDHRGTIIRVNEAWRHVADVGRIPAERVGFVGENYLEECRRAEDRGVRDAGEIRLGIEAVLDGRTLTFRYEYHDPSPRARWYELRVDWLDRGLGGAILTHIDITEQRLAELKEEESRRELAHMGRVATVGELAAAVSHELRQPLMAIRANAEAGTMLVTRSPRDLDEAQEIFRAIVADTSRAANVIDHIRLLLRKSEPTMDVVDLNEVCSHAGTLLQRDAGLRQTHLDLVLHRGSLPVRGDPVQLQQVVINLALNGLDAASTSAGAKVVTISTRTSGELAEVLVRDTGPGISPELQQRIFDPFFSTKAQGLGMGLVIVRSILERHKGRVRAENDPAGGALFRVSLPVVRPAHDDDSRRVFDAALAPHSARHSASA
ncbi:MAG TPA: ATP-binding protein [Gemmatimonadaceae bacterium]